MANKLLKKVDDITPSVAPSFLSSTADTQKIVNAGTSGMETMDMIFKHVNKIANNLTELERQNELMDVQSQADENLKEYELSWGDKAKFDDENYDSYMSGLKNVYAENKQLIKQTKYATASDVETWNHNLEMSQNNNEFTVGGLRSQYKIKQVTDKTLTHISLNSNKFSQTGDTDLLKKSLKLVDNLQYAGVSDNDRKKMKVKTIVSFNSGKMDKDINDIISDSKLSDKEKMDRLQTIRLGMQSKDIVQKDIDDLVGNGILDKDENMQNLYRDIVDYQLKNEYLGSSGKIYEAQAKVVNGYNKRLESANKEIMSAYSDRRNGNNLQLLSTLESRPISETDLLDINTSKKYFGKTPETMKSDNSFVSLFSITDINSMKNENKISVTNGIPRSERVQQIISNIGDADDEDLTIEQTMKYRQLIKQGVISQFEFDNRDNKAVLDEYSYGENNKSSNKLNNLFWVKTSRLPSSVKKAVNDISPEKRNMLSVLITGYAIKHPEESLLDIKGQVSGIQISQVLKDKNSPFNAQFKKWLDIDEKGNIIGIVGAFQPKTYKENAIQVDDEIIQNTIYKNNKLYN